jgi:hypothetical protein
MISTENFSVDTHRVIIVLAFMTKFIVGLYIGRSSLYLRIIQRFNESYLTFTTRVNMGGVPALQGAAIASRKKNLGAQ